MFGGIGLLQGLIAALGAALFVGNLAALFRSPGQRGTKRGAGQARRPAPSPSTQPSPPLRRRQAVVMMLVGLFIMVWAGASLLSR